jgi:hypothetical protein
MSFTKRLLAPAALIATVLTGSAHAQTEFISGQPIGMDTQLVYPHTSLPGATGIDFSFTGAFAPMYPEMESHTVVITFEWGPSAIGPWTASPDYVNTVPGGMTDFFATGVFPGPEDAPFVAIHFYAGGLMITSGEFTHASIVPEPSAALLFALGAVPLGIWKWRRRVRRR